MCSKKRRRNARRRDKWPCREMVYSFFSIWRQVDEKRSCTKRSCSLWYVSDYLLKGEQVSKPSASQAGVLKADRLACICAPSNKVKSAESSHALFLHIWPPDPDTCSNVSSAAYHHVPPSHSEHSSPPSPLLLHLLSSRSCYLCLAEPSEHTSKTMRVKMGRRGDQDLSFLQVG